MTKSPDDVRNELKGMYLQAKIFGGGWREVAEMEPFKEAGISFGTLCSIAGGGDIPKRWWKLFGIQSRGSKDYQILNKKAKAAGWGSWSQYWRLIRDDKIDIPKKPQ